MVLDPPPPLLSPTGAVATVLLAGPTILIATLAIEAVAPTAVVVVVTALLALLVIA